VVAQGRELSEDLRRVRQQLQQLHQELQTANRDFVAFKQQFQHFRQEFQQTEGEFNQERAAFRHEVLATRHEFDQAQAACRQEAAGIAELKQRALAANHDLGRTYKRMHDIDQSLENTWERLVKQMDKQQRLVEGEAETARQQVGTHLETFLQTVREAESRREEAPTQGHHWQDRPEVFLEQNATVPLEGSKHLGLTVSPEAQILEVTPETPADRAGLQPGDVVVKVDGKPINTGEDLRQALEHAEGGKEVGLTVARRLEGSQGKGPVPEAAVT
jgi:C-terminal processing protease CtpA/Prc